MRKIDTSPYAPNYWKDEYTQSWVCSYGWNYSCNQSVFLKPEAFESKILKELIHEELHNY